MAKVKICGIRSLEAAKTAIDAGTHFLGFNFVPSSKRYIDPKIAEKIISRIKGKVKMAGVFQNADIDYVNNLASKLRLDFVQLHGHEDNDYISKIKAPVIKSVNIRNQLSKVKTKYFILDRVNRGKGRMVDFKKAAKLANEFLIFYAGGLDPNNVADAIRTIHPFAVDVAAGIETDGKQDLEKIKKFIKNAKGES